MMSIRQLLWGLLFQGVEGWTLVPRQKISPASFRSHHRVATTSSLAMGLMDSISNFLQNRQGDFVKLGSSDAAFGPGPLLLVYGIPPGIGDDEIQDMIEDGAPIATQNKCQVVRVSAKDNSLLDLTLADALSGLVNGSIDAPDTTTQQVLDVPVLFFSGFQNDEMLAVYNILGREIYEETAGQAAAACAKVVPNAMEKPLRQVLEEISGDHQDAMSLDSEQQ